MLAFMASWLFFSSCSKAEVVKEAEAEKEAPSIGVVDWRTALLQSKAAAAESKRMQQENIELVARATELEREIQTKSRSLEKDRAILSEEEIATLNAELNRDMREFDALHFRLQRIQAEAEARFFVSQRDNIDQAMKTLTAQHKLDFVFERQVLVYGRRVINLTDELIKELDKIE